MKYPINEDAFVAKYIEEVKRTDEVDIQFAKAIVRTLNSAYKQGVEDGKKTT